GETLEDFRIVLKHADVALEDEMDGEDDGEDADRDARPDAESVKPREWLAFDPLRRVCSGDDEDRNARGDNPHDERGKREPFIEELPRCADDHPADAMEM